MPKATLSFKLPEEKEEFDIASKAGQLHCVIYDLDQYLRQMTKYASDLQSEEITQAYQNARDRLWKLLNESNIEL